MLFGKYIKILRTYYKKSISQYEICSILFDFIIDPADLRNEKNEVLTVEKGQISRMVNGQVPVHTQIRDHIYDQCVLDVLVENFEEVVLPELNPEVDDLCYKMMQEIKKDNISPARLSDFQLLAKSNTLAAFLAKVFIYVIVENDNSTIHAGGIEDSGKENPRSSLAVKGIERDCLSDKASYELFLDRVSLSKEEAISKVQQLYTGVNNIHLCGGRQFDFFRAWQIPGVTGIPYKVSSTNNELITSVAEILHITLSEGFFDFGGLERLEYLGMDYLNKPNYRGTEEEEKKAEAMNQLIEGIKRFTKALPYIDAFKNTYCMSFALSNDGTDYDEDVIVDMYFKSDELLAAEDIAKYDTEALKYLVEDCEYEQQFEIQRGRDFIDHFASKDGKITINPNIGRGCIPFLSQEPIDYEEKIRDMLGYYYCKDDEGYMIEVKIDRINQHTAVAFPTVILVNPGIKDIRYTIKSKRTPCITEGIIEVKS